MKTCPECDEQLADDAQHCGHCGQKLEEDDAQSTQFGLGAVSPGDIDLDEDEEESDEGTMGSDAAGADPSDGSGPSLPTPGEISDDSSPDDTSDSGEISETSPVDLTSSADGKSEDGEGAAFAKTATMSPVDEQDDRDDASSTGGGPLGGIGESEDDSGGPSLQDDSSRSGDDRSPFASGTGGADDDGRVGDETGPGGGEDIPDTSPALGASSDHSEEIAHGDDEVNLASGPPDHPETDSSPQEDSVPHPSDDSISHPSDDSFRDGGDAPSEPGSGDDLEVADVGRDEPQFGGGAETDSDPSAGPLDEQRRDDSGADSSALADDDRFGGEGGTPVDNSPKAPDVSTSPNTDDDKLAGIAKTYVYILAGFVAFGFLSCVGLGLVYSLM